VAKGVTCLNDFREFPFRNGKANRGSSPPQKVSDSIGDIPYLENHGLSLFLTSRIAFHCKMFRFFLTTALLSLVFAEQKPFWIEEEAESTSDGLPSIFGGHDDDEFTTAFAGITTFAHLPFINCLHPTYTEESKEKFDIAIIGAPFDTSVTYRPG
jgi:hypothetical protein